MSQNKTGTVQYVPSPSKRGSRKVTSAIGVFSALGIVLSTLSIVALLKHGFDLGFSSVLMIVIEYYEKLTRVFLGWMEPYIRDYLGSISRFTGINLHLYPHWRHVFILLELYFGSHVRGVRLERGIHATIFNVLLGIILSVFAGLTSGLIRPNGSVSEIFIAVFPMLAVSLYGFGTSARAATFFRSGQTWWKAFRQYSRHAQRFFAGGTLVILLSVAFFLTPIRMPVGSGLIILLFLILALALYRIWIGAWYANHERKRGQRWWERFHQTGFGTVGIFMILSLFGATLFILANAGLSLVGL